MRKITMYGVGCACAALAGRRPATEFESSRASEVGSGSLRGILRPPRPRRRDLGTCRQVVAPEPSRVARRPPFSRVPHRGSFGVPGVVQARAAQAEALHAIEKDPADAQERTRVLIGQPSPRNRFWAPSNRPRTHRQPVISPPPNFVSKRLTTHHRPPALAFRTTMPFSQVPKVRQGPIEPGSGDASVMFRLLP